MYRESKVKIWRMTDVHDAEMLKGAYVHHAYPWHSHEEISLGLVVAGAIELRTRTRQGIAKAGSFVLVNAEEAHQGTPATPEGWRCRTIHLNPEIVRSTASELEGSGRAVSIGFRGPTLEDPDAARDLLKLHIRSESPTSPLERQSRMIALIARLLLRHSDSSIAMPRASGESSAIRRARVFLDENLADKVSLDSLAAIAAIPRFRLLRAFQHELGLSPHAYPIQARIRASHRMLRKGAALADIACATGFADQAHLTRAFKAIMGVTPGQYRAAALKTLPNGAA
jgi:AraC-like DNA-binding protein